MPQYYNPYNYVQNPYIIQQSGYAPQPMMPAQMPVMQQSYAAGPNCAMAWVDGEIEARGRQIPQGVTQLAMWDTNKQVIYLKSLNQMGMPNPMQILRYTIDGQQSMLTGGQSEASGAGRDVNGNEQGERFGPSGESGSTGPDMSQYVTKQDFDRMKNELMAAISSMNAGQNTSGASMRNQNGSDTHGISGRKSGNENRGGNN